jgi:hypothetical protein
LRVMGRCLILERWTLSISRESGHGIVADVATVTDILRTAIL